MLRVTDVFITWKHADLESMAKCSLASRHLERHENSSTRRFTVMLSVNLLTLTCSEHEWAQAFMRRPRLPALQLVAWCWEIPAVVRITMKLWAGTRLCTHAGAPATGAVLLCHRKRPSACRVLSAEDRNRSVGISCPVTVACRRV
jgi:hypothetical protein